MLCTWSLLIIVKHDDKFIIIIQIKRNMCIILWIDQWIKKNPLIALRNVLKKTNKILVGFF